MGLYRFKPIPSGRMGIIWTLSTIRDAALIEFGCMGHMLYNNVMLKHSGVYDGCKLYSTHIDETDIALGDTTRLNHTIDNVLKNSNPRVIFLVQSSISEVIGTDLYALCEELQPYYPDVCLLPFGYGGFNVIQHKGVEKTLLSLAKYLPVDIKKTTQPTFNIIGSCADIFRFQSDANELLRLMEGAFEMKPICVMTSDTSIEDIEKMGSAHINLVIRREGEPAAKHLKKRFGTPYILNRPYGIDGTVKWIEKVGEILGITANESFVKIERKIAYSCVAPVIARFKHLVRLHPEEAVLSLGGHADIVRGILSFGCNELSLSKGTCWCDCPYMGSEEIPYFDEDKWSKAIKNHEKGCLMASGEALEWANYSAEMQIANPDTKWRLYPYEPPFIGFRGAINLANLWINENSK